jgi:hypothetical protein
LLVVKHEDSVREEVRILVGLPLLAHQREHALIATQWLHAFGNH